MVSQDPVHIPEDNENYIITKGFKGQKEKRLPIVKASTRVKGFEVVMTVVVDDTAEENVLLGRDRRECSAGKRLLYC